MAEKTESTNEKILRLFKEGTPIPDIADQLTMPVDNIKGIIEKRIPDYLNYKPVEKTEPEPEPEKSLAKMSLSEIFGIKKKSKLINMNKYGFSSEQACSIADMLKNGESYEKIAETYKVSVEDVKAVDELKTEHFHRQSFMPSAIDNTPKKKEKTEKPGRSEIKDTIDVDLSIPEEENTTEKKQTVITRKFLANISAMTMMNGNKKTNTISPITEEDDRLTEDLNDDELAQRNESSELTDLNTNNNIPESDLDVNMPDSNSNDSTSESNFDNKTSESEPNNNILNQSLKTSNSIRAQAKINAFFEEQLKESRAALIDIQMRLSTATDKAEEKRVNIKKLQDEYSEIYKQLMAVKDQFEKEKNDYNACLTEVNKLQEEKQDIENDIAEFSNYTA